MHENTSGSGNTVLGNSAFYRNTEGSDNTALGNNALPFNTTGTLNTAVGANTLKANVTGGDNTALGNNALSLNEGSRNTALGYNALTNVTDANNSVAVGASALGTLQTGLDNIGIGKSSASTLTSGNNNVVIGTSAQPSSATVSNEVTIGNNDITRFTTVGGKFKYIIGASYNMLEMKSKDDSQYLRNLVYDNADNKIISSGDLTLLTGESKNAMNINSNGDVDIKTSLKISGIQNGGGVAPNVFVGADGTLYSTVTTYSTEEEVDKKLAIKDKLIEKLSARLDKLEKRIK